MSDGCAEERSGKHGEKADLLFACSTKELAQIAAVRDHHQEQTTECRQDQKDGSYIVVRFSTLHTRVLQHRCSVTRRGGDARMETKASSARLPKQPGSPISFQKPAG